MKKRLLLTALSLTLASALEANDKFLFPQAKEGWEFSSKDFYRALNIEGMLRFSTFAANREKDVGIAFYRFRPESDPGQLQFMVYGGNGSVLLIEDNGKLNRRALKKPIKAGQDLRNAIYGQVLAQTSGPRKPNVGKNVAWNLEPFANKDLILAIVDDTKASWGFLGVSPFVKTKSVANAAPTKTGPASENAYTHNLDTLNRTTMPGSPEWSRTKDVFFDRHLFRNKTPFISTHQRANRNEAQGALWRTIKRSKASDKLEFGVRGGRSQIMLLDGAHDFSQYEDAASIASALKTLPQETIVYAAKGNDSTDAFSAMEWKLESVQKDAFTILILDNEIGEWGFVDITTINY